MGDRVKVKGGCHCGAVRFEAAICRRSEVQVCNCSMCDMCGFEHLIIPASQFRLLSDVSMITEYRFNSEMARHLFCSVCGVKSFYVPRSNPNGYSLNARCLEIPDSVELNYSRFDGRNWSRNASALAHLSDEQEA